MMNMALVRKCQRFRNNNVATAAAIHRLDARPSLLYRSSVAISTEIYRGPNLSIPKNWSEKFGCPMYLSRNMTPKMHLVAGCCKRHKSNWANPVASTYSEPTSLKFSYPFWPAPKTVVTSHTRLALSTYITAPASNTAASLTSNNKASPKTETVDEIPDDGCTESETMSSLFKNSSNQKLNLLLHVDMDKLKQMASKRCTPLSLKDMYKYAVKDVNNSEQRLWNAQFLHKELPIRMAQRAYDLLTLPHGLNETAAILQVAHVYLLYLEQFENCPVPTTVETEERFTNMLQHMILERSSIPNAIAKGIDVWAANQKGDVVGEAGDAADPDEDEEQRFQDMEDALYRFFTARVGVRFLTQHHIMSSPKRLKEVATSSAANSDEDDEFFLGCIQTNCEPVHEVRKVVKYVQKQTEDHYGTCPEIQIIDTASSPPRNGSTLQKGNFTYVPHHLRYMVGELLKNSCRATIKKHVESKASGKMPPIRIVIVKGEEDVTIKIADRGGGIPRSKMSKIWKFAHSTAASDENETDFGVDEFTGAKIRGFGLPLARIYARYLGGELTLKSLEGYGVDAYLHLPRLGDACENLPLQVQFSPSNLNSNAPKRSVESTVML
ncbi:two-component system histidine kinase [Nitzschia inconspicua]|uniref:Protein-serine/threonine kinase n=1 Tax=Nitzschia inconspicua TaxID=303405 RepID=A0A9K3L549_9STRA|nr:two-component system histidine kinase [Nitzschia inconspicua]